MKAVCICIALFIATSLVLGMGDIVVLLAPVWVALAGILLAIAMVPHLDS